ncbi:MULTISPECIES: hypothetical protein [unclassified Spirosoma]|nr:MULTISPECIES: hypothetical protein [unclassified Spirosoma]
MKKANSLLFGLTVLSVLSWASPAPKKGKELIYKVDTQQTG